MSLITYQFNQPEHAGERSQFLATLPVLQAHYQGREELVLFLSGKLDINGVDIDGLIIKRDAIVLVEFKNYTGAVKAQVQGDWFLDSKRINGGAAKKDGTPKTVFEQLKFNRRTLRDGLQYFTKNTDACHSIQALVVFTNLTALDMAPDLQYGANAWVHVTDIEHIGESLDAIKATTRQNVPIYISQEDIIEFIRNKALDEHYLLMRYSDVHLLPDDLYHEDAVHNGDDFSPNTLLAKVTAEKEEYKASLHDAVELIRKVMKKMETMAQEKDIIIQQQKAELLQIRAEQLVQRKQQMDNKSVEETTEFAAEEETLWKAAQEVEKEVLRINDAGNTSLPQTQTQSVAKRFGMRASVLKTFNVDTESMDDDQLDLIERNLDKSMIISGCAGSGKSVIAMYKAQQIMDQGGDVILIAYTKSLNRYMSQGKPNSLNGRFYYYWQWEHCGKPRADYVIVDEIQDFSQTEILQFIQAAKKCFFFFGDTAQSIYSTFEKKTMSLDAIAQLTGVAVSSLYNNYRLPKPVAKITQDYLGLTTERDAVQRYSENLYLSKEVGLPVFCQCDSAENQIDKIIEIIQAKQLQNVGILVPDNDIVLEIMNVLTERRFPCEFKYNAGYHDSRNRDTLNFRTQLPKLMTYHSAKGLQFETVILPYFKGAHNENEQKALYVAMTRTYRNLYILYSDVLAAPLSCVPPRLFVKE